MRKTFNPFVGFISGECRAWYDVDDQVVAIQYKEYAALLSQSGVDAPTAVVLKNTMGGEVVLSYVSEGVYRGTLAGAFPPSQTVFPGGQWQILSPPLGDDLLMRLQGDGISSDFFVINTQTGATLVPTDGAFSRTLVEVRVYNI